MTVKPEDLTRGYYWVRSLQIHTKLQVRFYDGLFWRYADAPLGTLRANRPSAVVARIEEPITKDLPDAE